MSRSVAISGDEGARDEAGARQPGVLLIALAVSIALNLALVGVVIVSRVSSTSPSTSTAASDTVDPAGFYAVFLDDKEAFVGQITEITSAQIAMKNIYYLTFEATDSSGKTIANPQASDFKPTIKKLGQEIWGPKDFVRIDRLKVLYYTQLRPDSPIVKAIDNYQGPKPQPTPSK
jgi:hypothetical protein